MTASSLRCGTSLELVNIGCKRHRKRTASAAEDFLVAFQTSNRGKVIGQKTCGSTGQPLTLELPGGGGARICTKRDTYPDGREFVGIGVIPDIEIAPTCEDIAEDRDVVLEKALEVLVSEIK